VSFISDIIRDKLIFHNRQMSYTHPTAESRMRIASIS